MSAEFNPWALSGVFLSTGDTFKRHVHGTILFSPVPWSLSMSASEHMQSFSHAV
ncbi:hypothetical protein DICSQDRAFT_149672 [Dichomitus squalens LYAD-421 SS1]|uniref:Uncharacterized protein n=1 Tax=Dichomitus squalens (strain LYAD-421) TaxID=732165 RepID=R7SP43_DICSQ|nr:uncharacterized protein DICSQDRAFT_149672 [Dichomitus squalens LYAD-421 SS1]EJF57668.1 hypothetical protein DICSQDRAFT_149672 [Dichomitus squalens LYAD-421 SS1]